MSLLTTLITGAGVDTPTGNLSQLDGNIIIGDIDTAMPLRGLKVVVDGKTTFDVRNSQPIMNAIAKFAQLMTGAVIGLVLKVATGRIMKNANIIFTNDGATVPQIFSYSDSKNGVAIEAATDSINANGYAIIKDFSALMVTPVANVSSFDVTWADGTVQPLTVIEADSIFATQNPTEANGRLDAVVTTFDNRDKVYREIKVNANGVGQITFAKVKLPDAYFKQINK